MTATRGLCTNVGHCKLAGSAAVQEAAPGGELVCRECRQPLRPEPTALPERPSRFRTGVLLGGAVFALMAAGAFWIVYDDAPRPRPERARAVAAAPAPATAARASPAPPAVASGAAAASGAA